MPLLTCNCPKCKSPLRFEAGSQQLVNITCPKCAQPFQVKVSTPPAASDRSGPLSIGANPAASFGSTPYDPFSDPVADWNQPLPLDTSRQFTFQSQPKRRKKSSASGRSFILPAVIALVSLGGVGLILVAIMLGKQFLVDSEHFSELSSPFSGSLFGGDSRSSIDAELTTLCKQVEEIGRSIPAGDQSQASAQRLEAELPKFNALFRRACRLPVQAVSLEEIAGDLAKNRQLLEDFRNQMPKRDDASANAPIPAIFWHLKTAAKPDQLVDLAVNKVTQARSRISQIASSALIDLPDPLTYKGTDFNWSDEDRRVLAIIRLQGRLEREALRSLAAIDPQAPLSKDLLKLHSLVDEVFAASNEQRKLLGKSMNGFIAFVPKGNPYEPQRNAALVGLLDLRKLMEAEATLPAEISFLFDEVSAVSESIESIIFGSQHGTLAASLGTGKTSKERFEDLMAADKKKELAAIQAEVDRKQEEQRQLAAAQLREQNALEEQRKREEERKRAVDERKRTADEHLADLSSGGTGRGFGGRGRAEPSEPFGPRPGRNGTPSGPNGDPTGRWGRGPQTGPPSDLHAPGNGHPALPQNQIQRPPAKPSDPALKVTITAANVKNVDSATYVRTRPNWLLPYATSVSISNGNLTIEIQNFDKPLTELETCFPTLEFVSLDTESRTIVAREK